MDAGRSGKDAVVRDALVCVCTAPAAAGHSHRPLHFGQSGASDIEAVPRKDRKPCCVRH